MASAFEQTYENRLLGSLISSSFSKLLLTKLGENSLLLNKSPLLTGIFENDTLNVVFKFGN